MTVYREVRVLVRLSQCNPRRFLVRDTVKIERWLMLARQSPWGKGRGIRVEVLS